MIRDILAPNLKVIFVGYNPGRASEALGHHFAGPGNYFWALIYDAGLTSHRLTPTEDGLLPYFGLGITNLVDRMTPGSADLDEVEMRVGGERLHRKLLEFRPRATAFLGKDLYRSYRALTKSQPVGWGLQEFCTVPAMWDVVLPNPSRRSTIAYDQRLRYFKELAGLLEYGLGKP